MDRMQRIPPELMGLPAPNAPLPAPAPGSFIDAPSEDPMLRAQQQPVGPMMGMAPGAPVGPQEAFQAPMSPLAPGLPPDTVTGPGGGQDPILASLMAAASESGPVLPDPHRERRKKVPKPRSEVIMATANRDKMRHQALVARMARDVSLYRQHEVATPISFSRDRETAIASAEFSTLVNKLSNMFSGANQLYSVPWDTVTEEKSAQIIEDALYQLRKLAARFYNGNLQREEFFYMFLHGRYVKRILPDLHDTEYPFSEALLDPATCFPTYGGGKKGMIRMVRVYEASVGEVLGDYAHAVPDLEKKLAKKLGYDDYSSASEWFDERGEVIEYWDTWWRYVAFKGQEVLPVTEHGLGDVPFCVTPAVGEPASMSTPGGRYYSYDPDTNTTIPVIMGAEQDIAEKGVSVYHYLINTHRVKEMLYTILYNAVEGSQNPATITYTAPHLMGKEPKPLDTKRGGNNVRQLNFQRVEGVPVSPRPTDFSPLFQSIQQEMMEGSFPPGMFGADQASNQTGSGADAMMQNAKDLVTPYIQAWERGQGRECELKLNMYVDIISPSITISAPNRDPRGGASGDVHDLSPNDIRLCGTFVDVKMTGLTIENEARLVSTLDQAIQAGLMSQKTAMHRLNDPNPDRTFAEIISERAMQHPEIMENFLIPEGFRAQGNEEFAKMWIELVVAPKLMQQQQAMMQGAPPGAPAGPGPTPGSGGGSQEIPNPMQGITEQGAGGPPPGQGRGAAGGGTGMMG